MLTPVLHTLAVCHHTPALEEAAEFLRRWLGFEERERECEREPERGMVELSNGALTLRLLAAREVGSLLELEVVTDELPAAARFVAQEMRLAAQTEIEAVGDGRLEQRFATPWGLVLVLTQKLSLDELGVPVPVPQTLEWESSAVCLVQEVLAFVPRCFRQGAQRRVAEASEKRVLERGRVEVGRDDAVAGLLAATPDFQQRRLRSELASRGFPVDAAAAGAPR